MGFSPEALYPYLIFASFQGILIHSNLRFSFGPLRYLLVTPQFHHWHHTAQPEAIDKNFAIHLPVITDSSAPTICPASAGPNAMGSGQPGSLRLPIPASRTRSAVEDAAARAKF